jgi:hypothetical protein
LTLKVITVGDTPLYGHAPTYKLSLTYLERQKRYGPDILIRSPVRSLLKKPNLFKLTYNFGVSDAPHERHCNDQDQKK